MRYFHIAMVGMALVAGGAAEAAVYTTGSAGGGASFSNYQPSLVLNQSIATDGIFSGRPGPSTAYIGMVHSFAGNFSPYGMPSADGRLMSTTDDSLLFSLIGTNYWGGDGVSTFALPNLVGRTAINANRIPVSYVGYSHGAATVTLTQANLPAHDHGYAQGATSITGGNTAFSNVQPSLEMSYRISIGGPYPSPDGGGSHGMLGEIGLFANDFLGDGTWALANGQLLPIAQYVALFSVIGTTYGGDGITTFALPNLVDRTIVGVGQGEGLNAVSLGQKFGQEYVTLTEDQMPAHDHGLPTGGSTDMGGGGQPFDNQQPSLGLNYLVAINGVLPTQNGSGAVPFESPFLGEVIAFAGDFAPKGWALADGRLLSIGENQSLFSVLGTTYGGDGTATFALPDLRGRSIVGAGDGFILGQKLGSRWTSLTADNLAAHAHNYAFTQAVPEPATWAMMIAGFAMAGGTIRQRRLGLA